MVGISEAIYGACFASFAALIVLVLLQGRSSGHGAMLIGASAITALWAADLAIPGLLPDVLSSMLDSLRLSAWLILTVAFMAFRAGGRSPLAILPLVGAVALSAILVGSDAGSLIEPQLVEPAGTRVNEVLHVVLSVGGLLAVENLLRNVEDSRRRNLWPLCLALGAIFAFELFMYAQRLMVPAASPTLPEGRGVIGLLAVPLIALAIVRNREWRIDIHVSRTVVLHTATLLATGAFFLALSAIGIVVRELGGGWGPVLQLLMLVGSAVVLVAVLGARELRVQLKQFISRNFFSHRFDYRAEWLRFVDTVSDTVDSQDNLSVRVIRALAQIIDSRAGTLWRLRDGGSYSPEVGWNISVDPTQKIPSHDPLISGFRDGEWIQLIRPDQESRGPGLVGSSVAVPLLHNKRTIAFVALSCPNKTYSFDRETFDLLRAAGKQAASYLAEEQSARALVDSRLLTDFSKRFAFVVHDVKNLASQLGLMLNNARAHLDNPEFRNDMLLTLENSVAKMNRLIGQLQGRAAADLPTKAAIPDTIIATLARDLASLGRRIETRLGAPDCTVTMDGNDLRSVLHHLLDNACEASASEGTSAHPCAVVSSQIIGDKITIDVVDHGPGMDEEFIRNELFRPFRSTKSGGLGIGAYQTRELLRMSGGDLDVISQRGIGTIMRMTLPAENRHRSAA